MKNALEKPSTLSPLAGQEWDRLTSDLTASGVKLTASHLPWLEQAATIAADMREAADVIAKDGAYIRGSRGLVTHPAAKRLDALRRDLLTALKLLPMPKPQRGDGPTLSDLLS